MRRSRRPISSGRSIISRKSWALQEAGRENGTAFLATKVGDLVVRVEKGSEARCASIAFQVDPATDFADIRKGLEAEGVKSEGAQRHDARRAARW